jgi:DNA-binding response OmpR family regulator
MASKVLVADDEPDILRLVSRLLTRSGYAVLEAADGVEALRAVFDHRPDAVVLDVDMPRLDGWQVLERIREVSDVPVLMLTAAAIEELDKVRGLRAGADDYVLKPFGRQELVARVEAMLRRGRPTRTAEPEALQAGPVTIDLRQRLACVGDEELRLTPLEFKLLSAFARHPRQILGQDQIIELVWNEPYIAGDQVKLLVGRLRKKLAGRFDEDPIETVRGFGYRFTPPD